MSNHKIGADLLHEFERLPSWHAAALKEHIQAYVKARSLSFADIAMPMRYALTGTTHAPAVGDLLELLGPELSLRRLRTILSAS